MTMKIIIRAAAPAFVVLAIAGCTSTLRAPRPESTEGAAVVSAGRGVASPAYSPQSADQYESSSVSRSASGSLGDLRPAPDLLLSSPLTNASLDDASGHSLIETSVIVSPTTPASGSVDIGYCAYMRFGTPITVLVSSGHPGDASWTANNLPTSNETLFNNFGDPVLASNPSPSGNNHNRVFLATTAFQTVSGTQNQIIVWRNEGDNSHSWVKDGEFDYNANSTFFDDKPAIAVSNNLGWVYLAYLKTGTPETVRFCRRTSDAGWDAPMTVYTTSNNEAVQGTRVNVDQSTGTIFISWLNWTTNTVNVMVSTDGGSNFSGPYTSDPVGVLLKNGAALINSPNQGSSAVSSPSFLSTSVSASSHSLVLVYHRRRATNFDSEIVMQRFDPANLGPPAHGFNTPVPFPDALNHPAGDIRDRWQGAVACAADATCVVSYYDHSTLEEPNSVFYKVYARRMTDTGMPIAGEDAQLVYGPQSSHAFYGGGQLFMEYQDLFYRNGTWYSASLVTLTRQGEQSTTSDVVVNGMNGSICVPHIDAQPVGATADYGTPVTVSFAVSGCGSMTYNWYRGRSGDTSTPIQGTAGFTAQGNPSFTFNAFHGLIWVQVAGPLVNPVNSDDAMISARPIQLNAHVTSNTPRQITSTWLGSADRFVLKRCSNGGQCVTFLPTLAQYVDNDPALAANTTYVYSVASFDNFTSIQSAFSVPDIATTMTFTPVQFGTVIDRVHINELLTGLNDVRAANGSAAVTWSGILPAGIPPPPATGQPTVAVYKEHITALRTQMNAALTALGIPLTPYTDSLTTPTAIKAIHFTELQSRTQ